jgi:hypothetical protein
MVTDKLRSYGAAKKKIMPGVEHRQHKGLNNRAEKLPPANPPTRTPDEAVQVSVCSQTGRAGRCWPGCYFEVNEG